MLAWLTLTLTFTGFAFNSGTARDACSGSALAFSFSSSEVRVEVSPESQLMISQLIIGLCPPGLWTQGTPPGEEVWRAGGFPSVVIAQGEEFWNSG